MFPVKNTDWICLPYFILNNIATLVISPIREAKCKKSGLVTYYIHLLIVPPGKILYLPTYWLCLITSVQLTMTLDMIVTSGDNTDWPIALCASEQFSLSYSVLIIWCNIISVFSVNHRNVCLLIELQVKHKKCSLGVPRPYILLSTYCNII